MNKSLLIFYYDKHANNSLFSSGGIVDFDLRNDDRMELLNSIGKKLRQFRYSYAVGLPELGLLFLRFLGSLPSFLVPPIDSCPSTTLMLSTLPGPQDLIYFKGVPAVEASAAGSISKSYRMRNVFE